MCDNRQLQYNNLYSKWLDFTAESSINPVNCYFPEVCWGYFLNCNRLVSLWLSGQHSGPKREECGSRGCSNANSAVYYNLREKKESILCGSPLARLQGKVFWIDLWLKYNPSWIIHRFTIILFILIREQRVAFSEITFSISMKKRAPVLQDHKIIMVSLNMSGSCGGSKYFNPLS